MDIKFPNTKTERLSPNEQGKPFSYMKFSLELA